MDTNGYLYRDIANKIINVGTIEVEKKIVKRDILWGS